MARRNKQGREINGILLLDKPVGLTSNSALQKVKRIFNARKAGHTGSLDPLASGLLPICLGEATKISAYLLNADKKYRAICKLGITTTTADSEGDIIQQSSVPDLNKDLIEKVLKKFSGEIDQIPPMHSALKKNGQPLYKLARQGIEVERTARRITIHSIELSKVDNDCLYFDVHCSKGTYIRTLSEDIGKKLGCGAHLAGLQRVETGPFNFEQACSFEMLESYAADGISQLDALLLPMELALQHIPAVNLTENSAYYVKQGQAVLVSNAPTAGLVRLISEQHFLGIGHILDDGRVAPKRLINN
ncbi:tRNA pseudouridine(55) synthase [hydrothermal vent metagenome]|uniref:tRNA pseudouridine(55) synthase n=1 Tax=hydrothermal vent metagenome TaxID=652676 RepID=A0A3B1A5M1_9ZZZZ